MLSKRRNPYWKTPQREANDYIPRQEYILQWMTTMCLLCFFVFIVMLFHLLISTKRISRTSYTSLHSFREISVLFPEREATWNIANPSKQDNGQSQVTSSNSSSPSFIILVLIGTPWDMSLFTSFTILLWSVGDTGLNPVEAEIFFQASFLKFLKLPPPCEGPLFTWMSFLWQLMIYILEKENSLRFSV